MTIWQPTLTDDGRPKYRVLADSLAADIRSGKLAAGTRLPPQRDLAYRLGVTVGTVGRAYEIVTQAGLVSGEVGRGTYVRGSEPTPVSIFHDTRQGMSEPQSDGPSGRLITMRSNRPAEIGQSQAIVEAARRVLESESATHVSTYIDSAGSGSAANRSAGVAWIGRSGFTADPNHVIVTSGAQTAIATAIIAGSKPGDLILAGELTYPSVSDLSRALDRRVAGIAIDEHGLRPDVFARTCRDRAPALLFDVPTLHNPTCSTMPAERREEIVAIARTHGVRVIEDEVYASLLDAGQRPPAYASLYPEGTFVVTSMSKSIAPGLRTGFLAAPPALAVRTRAIHYNLTLGSAPLMADIATDLITKGLAQDFARRQCEENERRKRIAAERLGGLDYATAFGAPHIWLTLPDPWRAATFAQAALKRGVTLGTADEFMVDQRAAAVHKVRICLGSPATADLAEQGLTVIADLLAHGPSDIEVTV